MKVNKFNTAVHGLSLSNVSSLLGHEYFHQNMFVINLKCSPGRIQLVMAELSF